MEDGEEKGREGGRETERQRDWETERQRQGQRQRQKKSVFVCPGEIEKEKGWQLNLSFFEFTLFKHLFLSFLSFFHSFSWPRLNFERQQGSSAPFGRTLGKKMSAAEYPTDREAYVIEAEIGRGAFAVVYKGKLKSREEVRAT